MAADELTVRNLVVVDAAPARPADIGDVLEALELARRRLIGIAKRNEDLTLPMAATIAASIDEVARLMWAMAGVDGNARSTWQHDAVSAWRATGAVITMLELLQKWRRAGELSLALRCADLALDAARELDSREWRELILEELSALHSHLQAR